MLYRQTLLDLSPEANEYVTAVSHRRRERLREEILATYALFMLHGRDVLVGAMEQADARGIYGAEYLEAILTAASTPMVLHPPCRSVCHHRNRSIATWSSMKRSSRYPREGSRGSRH